MDWTNPDDVRAWIEVQYRRGRSRAQIQEEILRHNPNPGFLGIVGIAGHGPGPDGGRGLPELFGWSDDDEDETDSDRRRRYLESGEADVDRIRAPRYDDTPEGQAQRRLDEITEDGVTGDEITELRELTQILEGSAGQNPDMLRWLNGEPLSVNEVRDAIAIYNRLSSSPVRTPQELFDRWAYQDNLAWEAIGEVREGHTQDFVHITTLSTPGARRTIQVPFRNYEAFRSSFNGFEGVQSAVYRAVARLRDEDRQGAAASAYAGALAVTGGIGVGDQRDVPIPEQLDRSRGVVESPPSRVVRNDEALRNYQQLYSRFRNHGLTLVAMRDLRLAEQIYQTGEIGSSDDARRVEQVFLDANYSEQAWTNQGDVFDGGMWAELIGEADPGSAYAQAGGFAGREAPILDVPLPDRESLDEHLRGLYRAWFRRDPTTEELSSFAEEINGAIRGEYAGRAALMQQQLDSFNPFRDDPASVDRNLAPLINEQFDVDPMASVKARARRTGEYMRLFGRKPEGMDEMQYVEQFESAAERFAPSAVIGDEAIRSGMESGSTQTTVGRIFGDAQVWDETEGDSTFLGRVAEAARTVARMT